MAKYKSKHAGRLLVRLTNKQALLAINGARWMQENPNANFTYQQVKTIKQNEGFLLNSGAKLYPLRNSGWYIISGYAYRVINRMPEMFKVDDLRVDEQETLRTLGFAV